VSKSGYKEINDSLFMREIMDRSAARKAFFQFNMCSVLRAPTLYVLCRLFKPEVVVETGVAEGFSSAFILYALENNRKGRLYSIDLPNQPGQELKEGRTTGWLVPEKIRSRWELILGNSKSELPALCNRLKRIDFFYHDSDHNYKNMTFELEIVFSHIKEGGLIIADDITDNNAFGDFAVSTNCKFIQLFKFGIVRK
jgi:predicted O-methyltransferase YrrM